MSRQNGVRPFVIGVAGGTCSGKTTVTERLKAMIGSDHLAVIKQDAYYIDNAHQPFEQRCLANYDHPDAFDFELTIAQLSGLLAGHTIEVPTYDYANHTRAAETVTVRPARVIVFEGILALYDEALRDLFDLKVFVDTDADVRLIRRINRDLVERGRTAESVMTQYMATVRPSHQQFIEPSKRHADVILPDGLKEPAIDVLMARVRELLNA